MSCSLHGCWTATPRPHPWHPIDDVACGFDHRMRDPRCYGCYRQRQESPMQQLDAINGRGDVARLQADVPS